MRCPVIVVMYCNNVLQWLRMNDSMAQLTHLSYKLGKGGQQAVMYQKGGFGGPLVGE